METELTVTTAEGLWSQSGVAITIAALDNTNGNKFAVIDNTLVIVRNTDAGPQNVQFTSQPDPETGRTGNINQTLAAGETRFFRFATSGWANSGFVLMPSGQSANLLVGVVKLR